MRLLIFKTLWGHRGSFETACRQARREGFAGIEGPAPLDVGERSRWAALLRRYQLAFIAEICTAGGYVPDRGASLEEHLASLEQKMAASLALSPRFITCLGGCDAWEEERSVEFFQRATVMAAARGAIISFETHRGRSLFNPWVTRRVCRQFPEIKLTCDFSHWCVVCERLLDGEAETLAAILPHAFHIHARVGYDQGPQVPDPSAPRYGNALARHLDWWRQIWRRKALCGESDITMTPEFGPDGYQAIDVNTDRPVGNLWQINCWMAKTLKYHFNVYRQADFGTMHQEGYYND